MHNTLSIALATLLLAVPLSAATLTVNAGGNLNAAIAAAAPGDEIVVQAGARFVGPFRLPAKPFGALITIRSSATLPIRQIGPGDVALLPRLATTPGNEVLTITNVGGWKLDGLSFDASTQAGLIEMQGASNITLERIYIDVDATGQRRCILGNGKAITLTRSWIVGCHDPNSDSQAFAAWDGAGPYTITNNHLEAESEVLLFGGEDSASEANVPSNILIEGNTITRPMAKKGVWTNVKNLIELKSARKVVIRGNLIENNWIAGQSGTAIVFTPRNQYNTAPWSIVEDVLVEQNIIRNSPSIFSIFGYDDETGPTKQTTGIVIRHNLALGSGGGKFALIENENGTVTIDHNTYIQPQTGSAPSIGLYAEGSILTATGSRPPQFAAEQLTGTNNLLQANTYGVHSSVGVGTAALLAMAKSYVWTNNTLGGKVALADYPPTTKVLTALAYAALFDADYKLLVPQDRGWSGPFTTPAPGTTSAPSCTFTLTSAPPEATAGWTVSVSWSRSGLPLVVCK